MNAIMLSWVASSYLLSSAVFLLPIGRFADIYGRKKIYVSGTIILAISCLFLLFASTEIEFVAYRLLQGFGSSMMFATNVAILSSVYPPEKRGKVLGITVAFVYLGLSLGPIIGGFMTEMFGWRSIFLSIIPLCIIQILLILFKLKGEWADAKGQKMDWNGSILYSLALIILMIGLSTIPKPFSIILIIGGVLGLLYFYKLENKIKYPIFEFYIFKKNKSFIFSNIAALLNYATTFSVSFLLSLYLQYVRGLSPKVMGMILIVQPLIQVLVSPIAGRLSDKIEARIVASLGMFITSLGLILMIFIKTDTPMFLIYLSLILLGMGFGLFSSPNTNAIMSSVEKKYYGIASGTVGTMRLIGQMFSMAIVMFIFMIYLGNEKIQVSNFPNFIISMKTIFFIVSMLCLLGVWMSLIRGNIINSDKSN
jgi:MFS family permease